MRTEWIGEGPESGGLPFAISPPLALELPPGHPVAELPLTGPSVMPRVLACPTILVFDSGVGGLTVFRELARARPDARFIYAADDARFPYGAIEEAQLIDRVLALMEGFLAEYRPDLVVIACNTASVQVLPALRRHFSVPFVGTVPAIKPACAASVSKRVSVLGTEATVKREYTQALIRQFAAGCQVKLVGSARLAAFAEAELAGCPATDAALRDEIAPCFVDQDGARTDTIVLACTHFPLLAERMAHLAPWPVRWLDPAPAIARRVVDLVGPPTGARATTPRMLLTSGRDPAAVLGEAMLRFGFSEGANAAG